jgi:hypothetical protein
MEAKKHPDLEQLFLINAYTAPTWIQKGKGVTGISLVTP